MGVVSVIEANKPGRWWRSSLHLRSHSAAPAEKNNHFFIIDAVTAFTSSETVRINVSVLVWPNCVTAGTPVGSAGYRRPRAAAADGWSVLVRRGNMLESMYVLNA